MLQRHRSSKTQPTVRVRQVRASQASPLDDAEIPATPSGSGKSSSDSEIGPDGGIQSTGARDGRQRSKRPREEAPVLERLYATLFRYQEAGNEPMVKRWRPVTA